MSKVYSKKIETCGQCPNFSQLPPEKGVCRISKEPLGDAGEILKRINDPFVIPYWCPLPEWNYSDGFP